MFLLMVQRGRGKYFKTSRSTRRFVFFKDLSIYIFCTKKRVCFQFVAFTRENIWHKALVIWNSMKLWSRRPEFNLCSNHTKDSKNCN